MPESPEKFYSQGVESFAEEQSIENLPEKFVDFIDRFMEEVGDGRVLDAGCGPGNQVEYFTENGLNATGIDFSEKMVAYARENRKGEYQAMDIRDLEFENSVFDGVFCNAVIHFFPYNKMEDIISELERVLKSGGTIFLSFKLGDEDYIVREKYGKSVKQYLVAKEEVEELLEDKNLEITERLETETPAGFDVIDLICRKQS